MATPAEHWKTKIQDGNLVSKLHFRQRNNDVISTFFNKIIINTLLVTSSAAETATKATNNNITHDDSLI